MNEAIKRNVDFMPSPSKSQAAVSRMIVPECMYSLGNTYLAIITRASSAVHLGVLSHLKLIIRWLGCAASSIVIAKPNNYLFLPITLIIIWFWITSSLNTGIKSLALNIVWSLLICTRK